MSKEKTTGFSTKHRPGLQPDPAIEKQLRERCQKGELPCAVAFDIAKRLDSSPAAVGQTADLMNYRLVKCQLGLFGYTPEKKIVRSAETVDEALTNALQKSLEDSRLPCASAWEIADRLQLRKMAVSSACEALGIKIKPCQLGAF
ncbi:MAG: hypothetical protein AMJ54_02565 [Deltaproteobacteria bacterium SG8_13]|nr:MAG: hypothetical protein AMJ54_02565 [Deltaproteobacteria bacterium SG8_13]